MLLLQLNNETTTFFISTKDFTEVTCGSPLGHVPRTGSHWSCNQPKPPGIFQKDYDGSVRWHVRCSPRCHLFSPPCAPSNFLTQQQAACCSCQKQRRGHSPGFESELLQLLARWHWQIAAQCLWELICQWTGPNSQNCKDGIHISFCLAL